MGIWKAAARFFAAFQMPLHLPPDALSGTLESDAMKSLRLYTGNRLDLLAELLAKVLEAPLASPLHEEIIVVQSQGMERWLSLQLARHFGVCANIRFPFPNAFVYQAFQSVIPGLPDVSLFDPELVTWRIMKLLPDHLDEPGFESLKHYLDRSPWSLKQLQLARRIAETFDQYVLYRPDLISRWELGAEDHWQAVLWRDLAGGLEQQHRAALGKVFLERIRKAAPGAFVLPQRVSFFGISYLPPFHLQILDGLAQQTEVNLFFLNPCREYWGDIASDREMRRLASSATSPDRSPEELFLERGNPLLASMGTLGKDFLELLTSLEYEETSRFHEPGEETLLACLQADILNLRDRAGESPPKTAVPADDRSLEVHSCHSPMREVEVLYDLLLELFEQDPALLPKDILVMTPTIETYAPFIQAVFDTPEDERKRIPYSIADRSMRKESQVVDTFLAMLELWDERLTAPQVLGILESPAVRTRFGLTDADLDHLLSWVRAVRIRWGVDERDRLRWSPHAFRENTWRGGLERLLLGYALPGHEENLFCGILPYDHIEGSEASVLGNFLEFTEQLFQLVASLSLPRSLSRWSTDLMEVLSRFFLPDEDARREFLAVRQVLSDLASLQELTGFAEAIDIKVIKWHLEKHLEREGFGLGFLTGGITFCSLLPMRSIPFKVIGLIGMDGDAFPRQPKTPDFDLIARHPQPGDRSRRNDDRYLFLEALISAREKFIISYTGQSFQDNSPIPPSVLVSELLDYIHRAFIVPHGDEGELHPDADVEAGVPPSMHGDDPESFIVKHRLQPFSIAYFRGDHGLFTYSDEWRKTAGCMLQEKTPPPLFIATPLAPPEEELKNIKAAQLSRFFGNPARFFLDKRLGIYPEDESTVLEETECFHLAGLEKHALGQTLIESRMAGRELTGRFPFLKASGILPHGVPGELAFQGVSREVERFARQMEPYVGGEELEPLELDFPISDFTVAGSIPSIFPEHLVHYRFATIRAKDHLSLWIQHLILNCVGKPGYPRKSLLLGLRDRKWWAATYAPVENCRELLEYLLRLYWQGLSKPLHFFPETSFRYAEQVLRKGTLPEKALLRAKASWTGDNHHWGEGQDLSLQLCFKADHPLDTEFQTLSEAVFGPLLASRKEI